MKPIQLTLDDVQKLCTEVRSLTAAKLPLEPHLADAGRGHGHRLSSLCQDISGRLQNGEPIETLVAGQQPGASRMLAATLAAGMQSGDMSTSVELLGDLASDLVSVRTQLTRAMAYPLVICLIAGALFLFAVRLFLQQVFEVLVDLGTNMPLFVYHLAAIDERYPHWPWFFPGLLAVIVLLWMISGRAGRMAFRGPELLLLLIPGVRDLIRDLHFYALTRMTRLLVERQLPLPDALTLAGSCVGSLHLESACAAEAECIRRGQPSNPPAGPWRAGQVPPMLHAAISHPTGSDDVLTDRLRGVAAHYQRRVGLSLAWLQHIIPGALLVVLGGGAVFVYGLALVWPVTELYRSLMTFGVE